MVLRAILETVSKYLVTSGHSDRNILPLAKPKGIFERELKLKVTELENAKSELDQRGKIRQKGTSILAGTFRAAGGYIRSFDISKISAFKLPLDEDYPKIFFPPLLACCNSSLKTNLILVIFSPVCPRRKRDLAYQSLKKSHQKDIDKKTVFKSYRLTPEIQK